MDAPDDQAIERLIDELRELQRRAGTPSLRELVKLSQQKMSKSTLNDVLSRRRRVRPPAWRLVAAFVDACHAAAQDTGLDRERLGTRDQWLKFYNADVKGDREAVSPLQQSFSSMLTTDPLHELNIVAPPVGEHAEASAAPLLDRLEEEVAERQASLSVYRGLLVVTNGEKFSAFYEVQTHITTIGRDPECDIWLNEPTVSRRHAEIRHYGDKFIIRDLGSKNGTFRENRRIAEPLLLMCYDELQIGRVRLMFVQGGDYGKQLQLQRHNSVRSRLIRDSSANTADIALFL